MTSRCWFLLVSAIICSTILIRTNAFSVPQPPSRKKFSKRERNDQKVTSGQKQKGYALRSSGKKIARRKPPKWELEGDLLFNHNKAESDSKLQELLKKYTSPDDLLHAYFNKVPVGCDEAADCTDIDPSDETGVSASPSSSSPFLWGDISVGPILAPKLKKVFESPTPIQSAVFQVLAKRKGMNPPNVVIASPTGSGKTLSFLLPLIATIGRNKLNTIMIITPTIDLALQTQRVLNQFWDVDGFGRSALYVVSQPEGGNSSDVEKFQSLNVAEMKMYAPPIIAGTPKSIMSLLSYCRDNRIELLSNMSTIILDEADRLLQTEIAARENAQTGLVNSPTGQLIEMIKCMGVSFDVSAKVRPRLVCVSATVGRSLRRQIMEITGAPSIDKAACLVTSDERTGKNQEKRKNSLLPRTIRHKYICSPNRNKDDYVTCDIILNTLRTLPPAPVLIFPGNVGVVKMAELLHEKGELDEVFTLRDKYHTDPLNIRCGKSWNDTPIFVIEEKFSRGLDIPGIQYVFIATPPATPVAYTHLAGRTGRAGSSGTVFTITNDMKDAERLVFLSNSLGINFSSTNVSHLDKDSKLDGDYDRPV